MSLPRPLVLQGQDQVVGFSADGRVLATIDDLGKRGLWDPETGKSRNDLAGELSGLPLPFSPDGRYRLDVESTELIKQCVLVDTRTGASVLRCLYPEVALGNPSYVQLAYGFTPESRYFIAPIHDAGVHGLTMSVWSLPGGSQVFKRTSTIALAMSPDGEYIASGSNDDNDRSTLELLSIRDQDMEPSFYTVKSSIGYPGVIGFSDINCAAFSSTGDTLVACRDGGSTSPSLLIVFDIHSKKILAEHLIRSYHLVRPRFIHNDQLISVHQDADGGPIAICLAKSEKSGVAWKVNSLSSNHQWGVTAQRASEWFEINVFKISPDHVPQVTNGSPFIKLEFPTNEWGWPSAACAISNDASRVAVTFRYDYSDKIGIYDSTEIAVVDVPSQKVIWTWRGKSPRNVHLSPDGRLIAFNTVNQVNQDADVKVFRISK